MWYPNADQASIVEIVGQATTAVQEGTMRSSKEYADTLREMAEHIDPPQDRKNV